MDGAAGLVGNETMAQACHRGDAFCRRSRFSVEQIVAVLKQAEVGVPVAELIRQVGISEQTLYRWKKQYKGLETDQVRQFKQVGPQCSGIRSSTILFIITIVGSYFFLKSRWHRL